MSQLDDLLDRSRAPGRFVERRRFSLSRAKAIEKLREFSLRDPRQYVLELVQSAVYAGATYVAIDVDDERLLLAWVGGTPLRGDQLENVFDYLFADRGRREQRHLVQLAVGLNALLQRKPKLLRLESGDGTLAGTVRMDLDRKGRGELGTPSDPLAGTYLLAEFGTNWLKRFQGDTWTHEAGLVEERCRFTPVPILLNGRAPFGWKASRLIRAHTAEAHVSFDDGTRRGVIAVPSGARSRGFSLVVAGVEITRSPLAQLGALPAGTNRSPDPLGLTGVVCDDDLRKTADQSDIVQDGRFTAMLHAVQPHATELLRKVVGRGYQPPPLPRLAETAVPDTPAAEPLSDPIASLPPRPALSLDGLRALPAGTPVFRVREEDVDAIREAADPGRFPHPVLVLRDAQTLSLDEVAPHLAVHRLGAPADVDFVRRALERRLRLRRTTLPARLGNHDATIELTLTLDGPGPCWGDPLDGDLPVRVAHGERTLWCGHSDVDLPGVAVSVRLDAAEEEGAEGLANEAVEIVRLEAWRLVPADPPEPGDRAAVEALASGLLAAHLHPLFVREGPDAPTTLALALPPRWGAAAERMLDVPLLPVAGARRSARALADLAGTDTVWTLDGPPTAALTALENRLAPGHVRSADAPVLLPAVAVLLPHGWEWWGDRDWTLPGARAVLGLSPALTPSPPPPGWAPVPTGIRGLAAYARGGAAADLADGVDALRRHLWRALLQDDWHTLASGGDVERARALGRLALFSILAVEGRIADADVFRPSDGAAFTSLAALRAGGRLAVAPRHGPRVAEPGTIFLTRDELAVVESVTGPLPLRFDDAPSVWRSLAGDAPDEWLLRHEVRIPGLRGWLGLRAPFDDTSGVLVQGTGAVVALSELDHALPCHGLLWLEGGQAAPTRSQLDLLKLARQQLYQELSALLDDTGDAPRRETAERYALRFARVAVAEAGGRLSGTAAEIASRIHVPDGLGGTWGTLAAWYAAPATARPVLDAASVDTPRPPAPEERAQWDRLQDVVAARLAGALQWPAARVRVSAERRGGDEPALIDRRWSGPGALSLGLDLDAPVVAAASRGPGGALELLLLECAARVARWSQETSEPVELLDLQRVLVAQRISGGATT